MPVVDWELCFSVAGQPSLFCVAGMETEDETVVLAARSEVALRSLCRELASCRSAQSAAYLDVLGACEDSSGVSADTEVYDDFVRMCNDFACVQRELASQNAKLKRVSAEKDRILNMAAHDLRNPLAVISLLATGLGINAGERLTVSELSSLNKITGTAKGMVRLIHDLLEYARSGPGEPELHPRPGNMVELIHSRFDLFRPLADAKRVDLRLHFEENLPSLCFDSGRIQQVVDNLLGNAIKFSPSDTEVAVHLTFTDNGLMVEVHDQGPGIPKAELTEIFQPFVKGSAHPVGGEASSGLGLAICRSILAAHGGKIWAENLPACGAAIKFYLPNPLSA